MLRFAKCASALFFLCATSFAQGDSGGARPFSYTPSELLAAVQELPRVAEYSGAGFYREIRYVLRSDRRITRTERLIYRVDRLDPDGGLDRVEAGYRGWHQGPVAVRARVISASGQEYTLDPATLSEVSPPGLDPSLVVDAKILTGPLPGVGPGAVVEVEQTVTDKKPLFAAGPAGRDWLSGMIPFARVRVLFEAPEAVPLHVVVSGVEATRTERVERGTRSVEVELREAPVVKPESVLGVLTGDSLRMPYVAFGAAASWNDVARGYADLLPKEGDAPTGDWPEAGGSLPETLNPLLTALHARVRYAGVEIGIGSIVPRSPAETLARGYGDCKDKSLLLIALLRERGVDARLALVTAGAQPDVPEDVPGFGLFNHAIVYIPGKNPLWIDPTNAYARAGQLPAGSQNRLALIVDAASTGLVRTFASGPGDNVSRLTVEQTMAPEGGWRVRRTENGTGRFEMALRQAWGGKSAQQALEEARRVWAERKEDAPPSLETLDLDYPDSGDLTRPFTVTSLSSYASTAESLAPDRLDTMVRFSAVLSALPLGALLTVAGEGPLRFAEPYRVVHSYRYILPPGYRVAKLPPPRDLTLGPATWAERYEEEPDGTVRAELRFDLVKSVYEEEEAQAFRSVVRQELQSTGARLSFHSIVEGHIAAGRFVEALREAERLVDANPKSNHLRYQLVSALLAVGAGDGARRMADQLTDDAPDDPVAWAAAGRAYAHDALGRFLIRGADRSRSIAAYRKALDLDPNGKRALEDLVKVLEVNDDGSSHAPDASLDEAFDLLSSVQEGRRKRGHNTRLADYLAYQGKYAEALQIAAAAGADPVRDELLVALHVVSDGIEGARAKLDAIEPTSRAHTLTRAAARLAEWRRYEPAGELMKLASASEGAAASLGSWVSTYAARRRHEELNASLDEPIGVAQAWVRALYLEQDWRTAVEPLATERCGKAELRSAKAEARLWSNYDARIRIFSRGDHRAQHLDAFLSSLEWRVEGDDSSGYHVTARTKGRSTSRPTHFFIAREGDSLRLIDGTDGVGPYLWDLGCYASFLLEEGRDAEAFSLLDYMTEVDQSSLIRPQTLWCANCERTHRDARLTAALLVAADETQAQDAVEELGNALDSETSPDRRLALQVGLMTAFNALGRLEEAAAPALAIFDDHPDERFGQYQAVRALSEAGRGLEAAERFKVLAARRPDEDMLRTLILVEEKARNRDGASNALERLGDQARASDWNNRAWVGVVTGEPDESDLEAARKAVEMSRRASRSYLNTLATLEAMAGNVNEARKLLLEGTRKDRYPRPNAADFLVAGLIAERLGLSLDARNHLERVSAMDPFPGPTTPGAMARARLAAAE